jgi:DNA-binding CsgD family transcriptional regulator
VRRATLSEKQKAVALLVALGQLTYREIARQVGIHYNSVTDWLKNAQVLALVHKFEADFERKIEDQALESIRRKNDLLLPKALEQLEKMLSSRSQRKQLQAIQFLMEHGAVPDGEEESQYPPQDSQSPLQLSPEAQAWLKTQKA